MGMNPEIKAQWVAALRGGEYLQGHRRLTVVSPNGDKHCCLGVLCDLALKAGVEMVIDTVPSIEWVDDEEILTTARTYDGINGQLPGAVILWAELQGSRPYASPGDPVHLYTESQIGWRSEAGHTVSLAALNDGDGAEEQPKTFAQIADLIEQYL